MGCTTGVVIVNRAMPIVIYFAAAKVQLIFEMTMAEMSYFR
jgi:hypothetical protein